MASKAKVLREGRKLRYQGRYHNRCQICGRGRGFIRFFGLCRMCFRKLAQKGVLPGVRRATW